MRKGSLLFVLSLVISLSFVSIVQADIPRKDVEDLVMYVYYNGVESEGSPILSLKKIEKVHALAERRTYVSLFFEMTGAMYIPTTLYFIEETWITEAGKTKIVLNQYILTDKFFDGKLDAALLVVQKRTPEGLIEEITDKVLDPKEKEVQDIHKTLFYRMYNLMKGE